MVKIHHAVRAILYITLFAFLMWRITLKILSFSNIIPFTLPFFLRPFGIILMIFGVSLVAWTMSLFVMRGEGTPMPLDPTKKIVSAGPYKYARNPMYLGYYIFFIGLSFWLSSLVVMISLILFFPIAQFLIVFVEEPQLEKRFGKSYLRYKKKVPRWIPKLM